AHPIAHLGASLPKGRCFRVNGTIPIDVSGVAPGRTALASAPDTVDVVGRADKQGRVRLKLFAPLGVPGDRAAAALLISVSAGTDEGAHLAALLGTAKACRALEGM